MSYRLLGLSLKFSHTNTHIATYTHTLQHIHTHCLKHPSLHTYPHLLSGSNSSKQHLQLMHRCCIPFRHIPTHTHTRTHTQTHTQTDTHTLPACEPQMVQ